MKHLKNFIDMVIEGIESYKVKLLPGDEFTVKYVFTDVDGNEYLAQFKNDSFGTKSNAKLGTSYELTYFVWDEELEDWSVSKIVNSNIFRLIKTIFGEIVPSFLRDNPWVKVLRFEGLAKEKERSFITQRTKLYVRYLSNNQIDGYKMENYGNRVNLVKIVK
jgi:hypothetical protein